MLCKSVKCNISKTEVVANKVIHKNFLYLIFNALPSSRYDKIDIDSLKKSTERKQHRKHTDIGNDPLKHSITLAKIVRNENK